MEPLESERNTTFRHITVAIRTRLAETPELRPSILFARSLCGIQAPIPDRLEIKGAWLTEEGNSEYVTPDKRDRDTQLFMFGFS